MTYFPLSHVIMVHGYSRERHYQTWQLEDDISGIYDENMCVSGSLVSQAYPQLLGTIRYY